MKSKLTKLYDQFFQDLEIDTTTGLVGNQSKRFATMPYVGDQYEHANKKILFVGMDIGKDEYQTKNTYQDFNERKSNVCAESGFNPHIAGTYAAALNFLKDNYGWEKTWNEINKYPTAQQATRTPKHDMGQNPLSYVALTNYYKFVNVERANRSGDWDRKYLVNAKETEEDFFMKEVEVFNPDVIVFQSKHPKWNIIEKLKNLNKEIYVGPHPSYREKGGRKPDVYVEKIQRV